MPNSINKRRSGGTNSNRPHAVGTKKRHNQPTQKQDQVDVDTSFIAERTNISQLHRAALEGNLAKIKKLVKESNKNLNHLDSNDESPLYYALRANQFEAFKTLLTLKANPSLEASQALDIPCLALYLKFNNSIDRSFYRFIKEKFGLNKKTQQSLFDLIKPQVKKAKDEADRLGKKLLVIIAELHDNFAIYQIKKGIFKIAKNLGVSQGYAERPNYEDFYDPLRKKNERCLWLYILSGRCCQSQLKSNLSRL